MKSKIRNGILITEVPLISPPRESKSGKTLLVATSQGPRRTALRVDGKPVVINVNAWTRPENIKKKRKPPN